MFDTALHSTLRQMRLLAGHARSWIVLVLLGVVVGLIGPFGTFGMPVVLRLAYWIAVVLGTAITGTFFAMLGETVLRWRLPWLPAAIIGGALAGLLVALLVVLINVALYGPVQPIDSVPLALYCTLICSAVTVTGALFDVQGAKSEPAAIAAPPLLERLPLPQRGRLLHLAVADHYVEVFTDRGRALLLLRLSDAIRETAPVPGLQVHRSHWVALEAVRRTTRQAGKPVLELENGTIVPISRSYLDAAKAAGLVS